MSEPEEKLDAIRREEKLERDEHLAEEVAQTDRLSGALSGSRITALAREIDQ